MEKLSDYEEEQLKKVMEMFESDEEAWTNLNGGYAECKLVGVDEEVVQFDLEYGKQDMGASDGEEHTDNITILREVLAEKNLSVREKVAESN